ncbi:hypothetical protein KKF11_02385 [Patescibacteria group bacterium]|nr:hypothetical protein [Patescibacteria group bacterium]
MLIIHGENTVQSRDYLNSLIAQAKIQKKEIVKLDGRKLDLVTIQEALRNVNLFSSEKLVIVERFFSNPKKNIIEFLSEKDYDNLVFWEDKELYPSQTKGLKTETKLFKLPAIVFNFLDSVYPSNYKISLRLFHECLKKTSAEQIFYLLIKQVRFMIIASDLGQNGLKGLHPYQAHKITSLCRKFTQEDLLVIHKNLVLIDFNQKTGKTVLDLSSQLDLFLSSI